MKGCSPQGRGTGDGGTGAEGQTEMKNKQLDNALKVGDPVRLVPESLGWEAEQKLRDKIGEVVENRDDGRVTVRYDNGRLLIGRDPKTFERVG